MLSFKILEELTSTLTIKTYFHNSTNTVTRGALSNPNLHIPAKIRKKTKYPICRTSLL